jgi:hypothetical protein
VRDAVEGYVSADGKNRKRLAVLDRRRLTLAFGRGDDSVEFGDTVA